MNKKLAPLEWTTQQRKVVDLMPYTLNPRQMTEAQVAALTKSLEHFGLVEIPVVDFDNGIIAGHQRLKVLQIMGKGDELVDVRVPNRKLTQDEFNEYLIRSNQNRGEWDFNILGNVFDPKDLIEWGFTQIELGMDTADAPVGATSVISFTFEKEKADALRELIKDKMDEHECDSREELFIKLIELDSEKS